MQALDAWLTPRTLFIFMAGRPYSQWLIRRCSQTQAWLEATRAGLEMGLHPTKANEGLVEFHSLPLVRPILSCKERYGKVCRAETKKTMG